jgi:uncharacterized protein YndB with AHSA1/START domain
MRAMTLAIDADSPTEPVIIMSRLLDAPRDKVWEALTRPEHVANWFGGHGFTNPVCEMDVRPGGEWRHVMRPPDGTEYPIHYIFLEVVKPERLVWEHADHGHLKPGDGPPTSRITVTLEARGSRTLWTMVAAFDSLASRDIAQNMGFAGTLAQGLERLLTVARSL